jgi:hypothetical protein
VEPGGLRRRIAIAYIGDDPKDEVKDCGTCTHEDRHTEEYPCSRCSSNRTRWVAK